ncbi:MAG: hypothetical protein JWM02_1293 [Frankiales bacterium]|nr:hypothetical protein [Frankiales bacterium]
MPLTLLTAALTPTRAFARALTPTGAAGPGQPRPLRNLAVAVDPNSKLPGTAQLTSLVGGMMTWVLLACVVAVLAGAATWSFGSRSGHFGASQQGRMMVLGGAVGAMITGAAAALVNFGFGVGGTVH